MDDYLIFATRLKQLREDMGLTQKDFADKVGFTQATLSAYENNPKNPSLSILINIAKKCNVSLDWLCGLSDKKTNDDNIITYADAIRLLLQLEVFELGINYEYIPCGEDDSGLIEVGKLSIYDDAMCLFFSDWQKMHELHRQDSVDDEVYSLWIEKTLAKYKDMIYPK